MAQITFGELTDAQKMEAADLIQKLEAIDGALAEVQTKRAEFEQKARERENFLNAEKTKVKVALRALRQAQVTE